MTEEQARDFLRQRLVEATTRSYGNLEQDRVYHFPTYRRNYLEVWGQYFEQANQRLETIRQFGQKNDLLDIQLFQFLSEDNIGTDYSPAERAVMKLRYARGYRDFMKKALWDAGSEIPFRDDATGRARTIDPFNTEHGDFDKMSPADWAALVDEGLLTANPDGSYTPTDAGAEAFEKPELIAGALRKGRDQMRIAQDVVMNTTRLGVNETFSTKRKRKRSAG